MLDQIPYIVLLVYIYIHVGPTWCRCSRNKTLASRTEQTFLFSKQPTPKILIFSSLTADTSPEVIDKFIIVYCVPNSEFLTSDNM